MKNKFWLMITIVSMLLIPSNIFIPSVNASEITYYFNSYNAGEAWANNPDRMVDSDEATFAVSEVEAVQLCDGNTCDGTDLGTISKVEIRAKGSCAQPADAQLRPVFGGTLDGDNHILDLSNTYEWKAWIDITLDNNHPSPWTWTDVQNLDVDVDGHDVPNRKSVTVGHVEIRVTYGGEENIAPIQSGEVPTNSSSNIDLIPELYVLCTDNDNDNMNATWWSNSSGAWVQFASNWTSFANNTNITQSFTNATAHSTEYWWSLNLTDGIDWVNVTYHFTTGDWLWIDITNTSWNLGTMVLSSSIYTNETAKTFIADIDNCSCNIDLSLQITTDGATWKDASVPGADEYRLNASIDTWSTESLIQELSDTTISSDIVAGQNETFDLRFDAPTATSAGVQQTITITTTIVKH